MRYFFFILFACLLTFNAGAQRISLDLYAGATNYQGDLQDKRYTFDQAHFAGGLGLSYIINDHLSARASLLFGKLSADDKYSRNKTRNLNFSTSLSEFRIDAQYFFKPLAYHSFSPYVFAGLAIYHYDPYTHDSVGSTYYLKPLSTEGEGFVPGRPNYNLTGLSIPFGGGVRLVLSNNVQVGLEIGLRKTFTDYLDDVSTTYVDPNLLAANRGSKAVELAYRGDELKPPGVYPAAGSVRGGADNKDWYYFTAVTFSFRLGKGGIFSRDYVGIPCPVNLPVKRSYDR